MMDVIGTIANVCHAVHVVIIKYKKYKDIPVDLNQLLQQVDELQTVVQGIRDPQPYTASLTKIAGLVKSVEELLPQIKKRHALYKIFWSQDICDDISMFARFIQQEKNNLALQLNVSTANKSADLEFLIKSIPVLVGDELYKRLISAGHVAAQTMNETAVKECNFREITLNYKIHDTENKLVYTAKYKGEPVVVKMLKTNAQSFGSRPLADFKRQIRIVLSLSMKNVVQVFGACTTNELAIVMEQMDGTLRRLIFDSPQMTWERRRQIALDVASGLSYIHHNGILHRNLSSTNVLYDGNRCKISGFGIAKFKIDPMSYTAAVGKVTTAYLAPELLEGLEPPYSTKSDAYAFGIVLWEIATGRVPYYGQTNDSILDMVEKGQREIIPDGTPPEIRTLIEECWNQDPKARPEMETVRDRLAAMVVQSP